MSAAAINMATGRGYRPRPERRRPAPRGPGWHQSLSVCAAEDKLLDVLLHDDTCELQTVPPQRVAAALDLLEETMHEAWERGRDYPDLLAYRVTHEDINQLRRMQDSIATVGARADAELLQKLRKVVETLSWDSAWVAAKAAARYAFRRYERSIDVIAVAA
jgi:hypothetical protein